MVRRTIRITYKAARRVIIGIVGATVVLIGVAMIVLPGPAFVVIPAGLAILSVEFAWARKWLDQARNVATSAVDRWKARNSKAPQGEAAEREPGAGS